MIDHSASSAAAIRAELRLTLYVGCIAIVSYFDESNAILPLLESMHQQMGNIEQQLVSVKEKCTEHDCCTKQVINEIETIKGTLNEQKQAYSTDQTPKSKRLRKSPRGLSVSILFLLHARVRVECSCEVMLPWTIIAQ